MPIIDRDVRKLSLKHSSGSMNTGTNTLGENCHTKVKLKIDFVNLPNNYWGLTVSGITIGTENDAESKPNKDFMEFTF